MTVAAIAFACLFLLIFLRVPLAIALTVVGFAGFWHLVGIQPALSLLGTMTLQSTMNYSLSVIPLFVLMGNVLTNARLSEELYAAANAMVGHYRGGLAMATVVACGGFGAICGSSLATAATMAKVSMPSMRAYGYHDRLATGSIAAGGTLGILIPPSVILIFYGVMTETHIGKLFAAGIVPGLLGILLYAGAVSYVVRRHPDWGPAGAHLSWRERLRALRGVWSVALLFGIVMGGIYGGIFTATEAAAVGATSAFILAGARGTLTFEGVKRVVTESLYTSAMLFAILIGGMIFTDFVNFTGVHSGFSNWISGLDVAPLLIVAIIVLLYLVLGAVLDSLSMILLTVPLFHPVVMSLGFDPVWFGILLVVTVEIGLLTPPIGSNVFVLKSVLPDVRTGTIFAGVVPFFLVDVVRVFILLLVPSITLFLPNLLF
ncbi:MAG: TRAP transporter large permease [Pseudooceanicola nanhaiensis]|uniref:TRAP transporter large permease n=1 Tax=Rhodobacterales TaxID=204455 RepID=UPI004058F93E